MPRHLERIDWMPSPPLAPDVGSIDVEHLRRMTLGDAGLKREVLAMFSAQSAGLLDAMAAAPADALALAHAMKGSARAIGAFAVADAAERLEAALSGRGELSGKGELAGEGDAAAALADLSDAVALARTAIDLMLRRP